MYLYPKQLHTSKMVGKKMNHEDNFKENSKFFWKLVLYQKEHKAATFNLALLFSYLKKKSICFDIK
jgi:hypothetical protein